MKTKWGRILGLQVLVLILNLSCGGESQRDVFGSIPWPHGGALPSAGGVDGPAMKILAAVSESLMNSEMRASFFHSDHINNLIIATDPGGQVAGQRSFRPSGELRGVTG